MVNYFGDGNDRQNSLDITAVVLVNLGTPEKPQTANLYSYLVEFLSDPRVVELPKLLWQCLLRFVIAPIRAPKSARSYQKIWTDTGSPLRAYSDSLASKTNVLLGELFHVQLAMRYGRPSVASVLRHIHKQGFRKVIVLPLYPQYSGSTSGSVFDAVGSFYKKLRWVPSVRFISDYHQRASYINAIAKSIQDHWAKYDRSELLLFSFHGIPQRYVKQGDPYSDQCETTAERIAKVLEIESSDWKLVYQSRFGREPWLSPYCDETLKDIASNGTSTVDVVCPGFAADCLETLEEINEENRNYFLSAGGSSFNYIPCLNDQDAHCLLIKEIVLGNDL